MDRYIDISKDMILKALSASDDKYCGALALNLKIRAVSPETLTIITNSPKALKELGISARAIKDYLPAGESMGFAIHIKNHTPFSRSLRNGVEMKSATAVNTGHSRYSIRFYICQTVLGPFLYINPENSENRLRCFTATKPQSVKQIMELIEATAFMLAIKISGNNFIPTTNFNEYTNRPNKLRIDDQQSLSLRVSGEEMLRILDCTRLSLSTARNRIKKAVQLGLLSKYTNLKTLSELSDLQNPVIDTEEIKRNVLKGYGVSSVDELPRRKRSEVRLKVIAETVDTTNGTIFHNIQKRLSHYKNGFLYNGKDVDEEKIMTRAANSYSISGDIFAPIDDTPTIPTVTVPVAPICSPSLTVEEVATPIETAQEDSDIVMGGELNLFPSSFEESAESVYQSKDSLPSLKEANALRVVSSNNTTSPAVSGERELSASRLREVEELERTTNSGSLPSPKIQTYFFAFIYNIYRSINNNINNYNNTSNIILVRKKSCSDSQGIKNQEAGSTLIRVQDFRLKKLLSSDKNQSEKFIKPSINHYKGLNFKDRKFSASNTKQAENFQQPLETPINPWEDCYHRLSVPFKEETESRTQSLACWEGLGDFDMRKLSALNKIEAESYNHPYNTLQKTVKSLMMENHLSERKQTVPRAAQVCEPVW